MTISDQALPSMNRLLLVGNQVSGFAQYRMELVRTLMKAGFDVHVALPKEPGLEDISREGVSVHTFYFRRKSACLMDAWRSCVSLTNLYWRLKPAVVHHICLKPVLYGGVAARIAGVPAQVNTVTGLGYVFASGSFKARFLKAIVATGLRFVFAHPNQRVVTQNTADRDYLVGSGILPRDSAVVIHGSGVDISTFRPEPEANGTPVVLMASRLLKEKGVDDFVAAARILRAKRVPARFVLVGEPDDGHPSAVSSVTLKHWRDTGDIDWLGWREDMAALIARSHIVCLPSYYSEGVPRILLEAAASGRPIVTTDSPGCRDVVRHGLNGLLVPVQDPEALSRAIVTLVENGALRAEMGRRGREIMCSEFSLDSVIRATLLVYCSVLVTRQSCDALQKALE